MRLYNESHSDEPYDIVFRTPLSMLYFSGEIRSLVFYWNVKEFAPSSVHLVKAPEPRPFKVDSDYMINQFNQTMKSAALKTINDIGRTNGSYIGGDPPKCEVIDLDFQSCTLSGLIHEHFLNSTVRPFDKYLVINVIPLIKQSNYIELISFYIVSYFQTSLKK